MKDLELSLQINSKFKKGFRQIYFCYHHIEESFVAMKKRQRIEKTIDQWKGKITHNRKRTKIYFKISNLLLLTIFN